MSDLIVEQTNSEILDDGSIHIEMTIRDINNWKFMRWIDLMNAYDDMRKSSYTYKKIQQEIIDDYDKDFKDFDGCVGYE